MKYVFLDIDGVMVAKNGMWLAKRTYPETTLKKGAAEALHKIVDTTGAKIVITSSWRNLPTTKKHLEKMFEVEGLKVHAYLPFGKNVHLDDVYTILMKHNINYANDEELAKRRTNKGLLISYFLKQANEETEEFVIIDNLVDDLREYYDESLIVGTDDATCLGEKEADIAIKVLKKKLFWRIRKWLAKKCAKA